MEEEGENCITYSSVYETLYSEPSYQHPHMCHLPAIFINFFFVKNHPYNQQKVVSDKSPFKVSFYHINHAKLGSYPQYSWNNHF